MSIIDLVLIIGGAFLLFAVAVKPDFFWQGGRMQRRRQIMGDRNTIIMYVVMAIVMIGVGLYGAMGGLG